MVTTWTEKKCFLGVYIYILLWDDLDINEFPALLSFSFYLSVITDKLACQLRANRHNCPAYTEL